MEFADGGDLELMIRERKESGEYWPEDFVLTIFT